MDNGFACKEINNVIAVGDHECIHGGTRLLPHIRLTCDDIPP